MFAAHVPAYAFPESPNKNIQLPALCQAGSDLAGICSNLPHQSTARLPSPIWCTEIQNYDVLLGIDITDKPCPYKKSELAFAVLNGVEPERYLHHVLDVIADWPINRVSELLP
jgi:hypothetical protein